MNDDVSGYYIPTYIIYFAIERPHTIYKLKSIGIVIFYLIIIVGLQI